jgi:type IV pilus assembly protein PilC
MATFAYEARKIDGELMTGFILADDMTDAGLKLAGKELFIIRLAPADSDPGTRGDSGSGLSRLKVKRTRVVWFMNQLSIMVETGITLGTALETLAQQATDPALEEVLKAVCTSVQEGRPLSDSMEAYPRTFPRVMCAMVRAAEHSGMLSSTLTRTASYLLKEQQIMRRFRGALMYPAFMFMMCIGITVFLVTIILPRFAAMFAQKNALLPGPTRFLLGIHSFFGDNWLWLLTAGAAAAALLSWARRTDVGQSVWNVVQLRAPLLGTVVNKHQQTRFFRTAAALMEAGLPLSDVLALVRTISTNRSYTELWDRVEKGVKNGERITMQLRHSPYISEVVLQMIECGDRTGRLGTVLARLADVLEDEYDQAVKTISQFIEPLMIIVMGGIIGFVAMSLMLPMFRASTLAAQ